MSVLICKKLPEVWVMVLALFSILVGCFLGSSFNSLFKDGKLSSFRISENLNSNLLFRGFGNKGLKFNPRLPKDTVRKTKYLLTIAVGIQQNEIVNKMVSKFSENFTVVLFRYDGKTSEWNEYEWSQRAVHITAFRQTKWWYVKRFLHPNIVAQYEYIFIWDEDFGVHNFNAQEYIKVVRKYGLEISQPAVTSTKGLTYQMTLKRDATEVHWQAVEDDCPNPLLPPCAAFVEIMGPVFSRNSWNCVWKMIQNDLVHGWGLDFAFYRCVERPHETIGVVDSQWINHLELPTLSNHEGDSINGKRSRLWVHARSHAEMVEFDRRMKVAENQNHN